MKLQAASISRPDTFHPSGTDRVFFNGQVSELSNQDETVVHLTESKKAVNISFALFGNMTEGSLDGDVTGTCASVLRDALTGEPVTDTLLDDAYADMERAWAETDSHATVSASTVSLFENGTMTVSAVGDGEVLCIRNGRPDVLYGKKTAVRGIGVPKQNRGTARYEALERNGQDGTVQSVKAEEDNKAASALHPFLLSQELKPGDVYVIMSKAVTEAFTPEMIATLTEGKKTATEMADEIMDALTTKNVPGDQSVIVCMIAPTKGGTLSQGQKLGLLIGTAAVSLIAVVIVMVLTIGGMGGETMKINIENYNEWKIMTIGDEVPLRLEGDVHDIEVNFDPLGVVSYDEETETLIAKNKGKTSITITSPDGGHVTKDIRVKDKPAETTPAVTRKTASSTRIPEDVGVTKKPAETDATTSVTEATTAEQTEATEDTTVPEETTTTPAETTDDFGEGTTTTTEPPKPEDTTATVTVEGNLPA